MISKEFSLVVRETIDSVPSGTEVEFSLCIAIIGDKLEIVNESFNRISFKVVKK